MIIVGDVHFKQVEPYRKNLIKFFDWLVENYEGHKLVLTGDFFDSSNLHNEAETIATEYLLKFPEVHICLGNHDISSKWGNSLLPLALHSSIFIYDTQTEIIIEEQHEPSTINSYKFLFLPHRQKFDEMKEYEKITGSYDYVISHITPPEEAFGSDTYIDISKIDCKQIFHGHIHNYRRLNKKQLIIGVPQLTRKGEDHKKVIIEIDAGGYKEIEVPVFMNMRTIAYGNYPDEKDWVYDIIDAPDKNLVYDKYKEYYIRDITLLEKDEEISDIDEFKDIDLKQKLIDYYTKENLSSENLNKTLSYF